MLDFDADVYFAQDVMAVLKKVIYDHAAETGIDPQKYAARFELVPGVDKTGHLCHELECEMRLVRSAP